MAIETVELALDQNVRDAIVRHALAHLPNEACGLIAGDPGGQVFFPVDNVHHDPRTGFRMDVDQLVAAYQDAEDRGLKITGVFHSHPNGHDALSADDTFLIESRDDGLVSWLLIPKIRAFRKVPNGD